jgi:hypothetical protein
MGQNTFFAACGRVRRLRAQNQLDEPPRPVRSPPPAATTPPKPGSARPQQRSAKRRRRQPEPEGTLAEERAFVAELLAQLRQDLQDCPASDVPRQLALVRRVREYLDFATHPFPTNLSRAFIEQRPAIEALAAALAT